jgi:HlyD family secretion protein
MGYIPTSADAPDTCIRPELSARVIALPHAGPDAGMGVWRVALSRPSITKLIARLRSIPRPDPADGTGSSPRYSPTVQRAAAASVVGALIAVGLVACSSDEPATPQTARVTRAAVTTGVTSTGSLTAITEQNLGFAQGGKLTSVAVRVGDRVTAGQVLATIDDFELRQVLAQQQAQLNSQQAVLNRIVNGTQVSGARNSLGQAQEILDATEEQVDQVQQADRSAIDRAEKQLGVDKKALDQAKKQRRLVRDSCGDSDDGDGDGDGDSLSESAEKALKQLEEGDTDGAAAALPNLTGLLAPAGSSCEEQLASAETNVINAERQVEASRTTLESARQQQDVDAASGQVSIENSRQGVVNAQNTLDSASTERPFNIDQQRALVANGQALVRAAQRDVDDATLRASVDGTVSAINGAVGEYLSPSSGTTALAPGSDAAIPGTEAVSGGTGATGGAATATRPGGSQFLVLEDVNQLQLVLPFEESDAAQIQPNQNVSVGFDALPELTRNGTVLSVAPSGTAISGIISYYVTVVLTEGDPRLKDGQTARATVITQQLDNVLSVPNAAVRRQGDRSEVTVVGANGEQRPVTFEAGVVGAERTQVLSGLFDGQEVVIPAGR